MSTITHYNPEFSLSREAEELLTDLFVLSYRLRYLEQTATDLGVLLVGLPDATPPVCKTDADVMDYAAALHKRFMAANEVVWRAEEPLEPQTETNKPIRELGRKMHGWYEAWKFRAAFSCGFKPNSEGWPMQPYFGELLSEAMAQSQAGDEIAADLVERNWGIVPKGKAPKPMLPKARPVSPNRFYELLLSGKF